MICSKNVALLKSETWDTGSAFKVGVSVSVKIWSDASEDFETVPPWRCRGIMEMQPQQEIDCPQLGNYTATK